MITPSFNLTSTERVLPKLFLDFTTASLNSLITFTRSDNTATVVNSSGFIAPINANLPRFDFDPSTLVCKGLLIEESRANLLLYSNNFSQANWTRANATISTPVGVSPDGTQNINRITFTAAGTNDRVLQSCGTIIGTVYTSSIWLKGTPGTTVTLELEGSVQVVVLSNNFVRYSVTFTAIGLNSVTRIISRAGNTATVIDCYGAQIEAGAFFTSYIPTVASQITRNVDVATITGANFSNWWYTSEGAAIVQALPSTISGTRPSIQFDDNTAIESIALRGVAADPQLFVVDGGLAQATLDAGTITANTVYKLGGAWKASSFATTINGAAAVTSASGTLPTVTQARLGSDGTNYLNGHLQNLRYWPQRLTNAEVQAFSK